MCGIGAILSSQAVGTDSIESTLTNMMGQIAHRGDEVRFNESHVEPSFGLSTNRLAIVERGTAKQPSSSSDGSTYAILNGQIYNYKTLRLQLARKGHVFHDGGDCEVLLHAYLEYGDSFVRQLDGMFAFVLVDKTNQRFLIGRDHIGIKPLYYAKSADNTVYVASEMKALTFLSEEIHTVPPGSTFDGSIIDQYVAYDESIRVVEDSLEMAAVKVRDLLKAAVQKRVDTDLPVAVMYSGGIDSAIVLELAASYHQDVTAITFGLHGSSDIEVARRHCIERRIRHLIYTFTEDDLQEALSSAVYYGEFFEKIDAFDSAIAHFGYKIAKALGFKVTLCGEGSDEIFFGYDLFKQNNEPRSLSFYRLNNLHRTDLQRVDRASMRHTVEARVPFMDQDLVRYVVSLNDKLKICDGVEKLVLREAFKDILPEYIRNRPKIRMPDGSGAKNVLIDHIASLVDRAASSSPPSSEALALGLDRAEEMYVAKMYLAHGYKLPNHRFKREGLDYSPSGYFEFVS